VSRDGSRHDKGGTLNQVLRGCVSFANGAPAADVHVRVFDKDASGKGDDDLTLNEGRSDEQGRFEVRFAPSKPLDVVAVGGNVSEDAPEAGPFNGMEGAGGLRLQDGTDVDRSYAQFTYTFNGQPRVHKVFLRPFQREFRLPEMPPVAFKPSEHGFKFVNRFPGYYLPFSVSTLPELFEVKGAYGLCGGMSAAAYDFMLAGRPIPKKREIPKRGTKLHRYLLRRQNDSFGRLGAQIVRFVRWAALPDDGPSGTWRKSFEVWEALRVKLDDRNLQPLGLVYISTRDSLNIWENHQVLAHAYTERDDGGVDIHLYDPNFPLRDDVYLRCEPVTIATPGAESLLGLRTVQRVGNRDVRPVRGFFAVPYVPVEPPAGL